MQQWMDTLSWLRFVSTRAYARFQSVNHSNGFAIETRALRASFIAITSFVRVPSVNPYRSSSVVRGIHVRSKTSIDPSSAARAPLETRAPTLLLATLTTTTTTRRDATRHEPRHKSKDVPCARKVFHRRASVRVSPNASTSQAGGHGASKTQIVVWFYLYVQTVMTDSVDRCRRAQSTSRDDGRRLGRGRPVVRDV